MSRKTTGSTDVDAAPAAREDPEPPGAPVLPEDAAGRTGAADRTAPRTRDVTKPAVAPAALETAAEPATEQEATDGAEV